MSTSNELRIGLADAVQSVRDELLTAARRASGQDVVFELGDVEMEFTIEIRRESRANAKVKAWIAETAIDGVRINSNIHKVSFVLRPQGARTGAPLKISNETEGSADVFGRGANSKP